MTEKLWVPVTDWIANRGFKPGLFASTQVECLFRDGDCLSFVIGDCAYDDNWYLEDDSADILMYRVLEDRAGWVVPTLQARVATREEPGKEVELVAFDGASVCYRRSGGGYCWVDALTGRALLSEPGGYDLIPYAPKPKTVWDLKDGDYCYLIQPDGKIYNAYWDGEIFSNNARDAGNITITREEAEARVAKWREEALKTKGE